MLEPIVGKDKVKATVNVNLDFDSKQNTQTVVDPNKVIISQENSKSRIIQIQVLQQVKAL